MNQYEVSVVIGFKDWGLDRLEMTIRSLIYASGSRAVQVVVSDYGSTDHESVRACAESAGATYIYTPTNGTWSRSRALNAGFTVSTGDVVIATDADMVFSPGTVDTVASYALEDPTVVALLQCRDLPEGLAVDDFADSGSVDWRLVDRKSRLRPRWGMGGFIAAHRNLIEQVRGLDERMEVYGGEDIDFANRLRRSGARIQWVDDAATRMFHVWHPSSRASIKSAEEERVVERNRSIVYNDRSYVRNLQRFETPRAVESPIVSVVIATKNRPEFVVEAVASALYQTVRDVEVVVVDDNSDMPIKSLLDDFNDERIVYERTPGLGIAGARNLGTRVARGSWVAVLDDDDLMPPWRLEVQLSSLEAGDIGAFGSFANFASDGTLSTIASKKFNLGTVHETGGAPGHGTWLIRRDIMELVGYDENISSGIDNDFALRMLRIGGHFRHTGVLVLLRRMHDGQITALRSAEQVNNAGAARRFVEYYVSDWSSKKLLAERGSADYIKGVPLDKASAEARPYLPDSLVSRWVLALEESGGLLYLAAADWRELARLRKMGVHHVVLADSAESSGAPSRSSVDLGMMQVLRSMSPDASVFLTIPEGTTSRELQGALATVFLRGHGGGAAFGSMHDAMTVARQVRGLRMISGKSPTALRDELVEDAK